MVKGVVQDPDFDWAGEEAIRRPWPDTIIYEAHVRGLTMTHPKVPDRLRGTFLGMCSDPIIDHLVKLGISAIELLPIQYFLDDRYLLKTTSETIGATRRSASSHRNRATCPATRSPRSRPW